MTSQLTIRLIEQEARLAVDGAPLGLKTDWLPAIEQFGEGFFIHVDPNAIGNWLSRPAVQGAARSTVRRTCSLGQRQIRHQRAGSPQQATLRHLIYTATAGSLGPLGGLVATTQRFAFSLAAALRRLQICSDDPVRADPHPASRTDDRALHGAAGHGCLLIAETSRELRNVFFDRALIVDTTGVAGGVAGVLL